jgi:hypothetical protein
MRDIILPRKQRRKDIIRSLRTVGHLPQPGKRSALDPGAGSRNPRRLDRGPPLPEHGNASRTRKQLQLMEAA